MLAAGPFKSANATRLPYSLLNGLRASIARV